VGPVHGNKRHRGEIELTTDRKAVAAGSGCAPHGGGRRWPAAALTAARGAAVWMPNWGKQAHV
jgi:hypothetical protein